MTEQIEMVRAFMDKTVQEINPEPTFNYKLNNLSSNLFFEESEELLKELRTSPTDISNVAKEWADCMYILFGIALRHGFADKAEEIFRLVHSSNMAKNSEKNQFGKVVKGKDYVSPIEKIKELFNK